MALKQLNETLSTELIEHGLAGIGVHNLSPGGWEAQLDFLQLK